MINIAWMYPDILNLHGDRANLKAFEIVSKKMGIKIKIDRIEDIDEEIDFDKYDILMFNPGELKVIEEISKSLKKQIKQLKKYMKKKKIIIATGTTIALFSNTINRLDNTSFSGLKIVDCDINERNMVLGDDLYFTFNKMEIIGSQIQMIDIDIKKEKPFGNIKYGYGNIGKNDEGIKKNNVYLTNCLGPVLVKNPWLCEYLLNIALKNKKIKKKHKKTDYTLELKSLNSVKEFIDKKCCKN